MKKTPVRLNAGRFGAQVTSTVLLTLGRLPKALDLARGFAQIGWRVIVAEPMAWHLCRPSRAVARTVRVAAPANHPQGYLDELSTIIEQEAVDLVVPVSEEAMHVAKLGSRRDDRVRVFAESQERLLRLHHKGHFVLEAQKLGLPVPETFGLGSASARDLAARRNVVVKPVNGCAGTGVTMLCRGEALPAPTDEKPAVVQARIEGRPLSSFSLAHEGRVITTTVYEGTLFAGTVAVAFRRVEEHPRIMSWVETFIRRLGFSGFIAFDFIEDGDGIPWAIECNPRVTSGIHFLKADELARAIVDPGDATGVGFRDRTHLQQFFPCLTESYGRLFRGKGGLQAFRTLFRSRDVSWQASDPWPLILMTFTSYEVLRRSIFQGMSFGEAATVDIAWTNDAISAPINPSTA